MKKFTVEIKEYLARSVVIEAIDEDDALEKTKEEYLNENIVLYAEDYVETEFVLKN